MDLNWRHCLICVTTPHISRCHAVIELDIREVKIDFRYQYQYENSDRRMRRISNRTKLNSIGSREYRFGVKLEVET